MITPGRPVKDVNISRNTDANHIFKELEQAGGFEARNVAEGVDILYNMISDEKCTKFLSFIGAIVSTGFRGIIRDMVKKKWCNVVITTCGALDHDIARHFSEYKEGSFTMDDRELADQNIHRLGNILVPMESYGPLIEEKVQGILEKAYSEGKKEMSTVDINKELGVPGIMDGAVGSQVWMFSQKHSDFKLNIIEDANFLSGLVFKAEKSGALMLGGGVPKHHTLWWNQYREGLDYAVYVTTAQEFDGSLSGALVREAISWGKVTKNATETTIHAEITTVFPFMYKALLEKLEK
jgi:deoxyhypusine synthase